MGKMGFIRLTTLSLDHKLERAETRLWLVDRLPPTLRGYSLAIEGLSSIVVVTR